MSLYRAVKFCLIIFSEATNLKIINDLLYVNLAAVAGCNAKK